MKPGLDYPNSLKDPNFFQCQLTPIHSFGSAAHHGSSDDESHVIQIIYIPKSVQFIYFILMVGLNLYQVPTIAAINGHCYAGGLMLSLVCDYRVMTDGSTRNAWLCMNEVRSLTFSVHIS